MQQINQLDIDKIKQQSQETGFNVVAGTGIDIKKLGNEVVISTVPQKNTIYPLYICVNGVPRKINILAQGRDYSPSFPTPVYS